jgi:hypothetical protein
VGAVGVLTEQNGCTAVSVTIGVTWGLQGFASESDQERATSEAQRLVSLAKPADGSRDLDGFRGKLVEIIFSPTDSTMAKSLKRRWARQGSNL